MKRFYSNGDEVNIRGGSPALSGKFEAVTPSNDDLQDYGSIYVKEPGNLVVTGISDENSTDFGEVETGFFPIFVRQVNTGTTATVILLK